MKFLSLKKIKMFSLFCLITAVLPLYFLRFKLLILPTNTFELLALFSILVWFFNWDLKKRKAPSKFLFWGITLLIFGLLISYLKNNPREIGLGIIKSWFILPIFFSYALFDLIETKNDLKKILLSLYFSGIIVSLVSFVYKLFGIETYDGRLRAFFESPNHLAMFLVAPFLIGFYFLCEKYWQKDSKVFLGFICTGQFILLFSIFFTHSYATIVALFFSVIISLFIFNLKSFPKIHILTFFIFVFLVFVYSESNTEKFNSFFSDRSSITSRIAIYKSSFLMLKQNFMFGIGPGNFQSQYLALQPFFPPYPEWAVPQPHNLFLAFWLQTGMIGLIGFFMLIYHVISNSIHLYNSKNEVLFLLVFSYFIYLIIHGLVDTPFWKIDLAFQFWIFTFTFLSIYHQYKKQVQ